MSRKNPPAKWVLPSVINPAERLCITIEVPNDIQHRAAFFGAMQDLGSATKWADDPFHKAKDVALVWRSIIDSAFLGECAMPIIFSFTDCGVLAFSLDGGENWSEIADFNGCFVALNPANTARNNVVPTNVNTVPLTLNALAGHSVNISEVENAVLGVVQSVAPNGFTFMGGGMLAGYNGVNLAGMHSDFFAGASILNLKGVGGQAGLKIWRTAGAESLLWLFESEYFDATRMYWYANGQKTAGICLRDDGRLGLGIDTPLARLHVKNQSAAECGLIIQAAAAATLDMQENRLSDGTIVSGVDSEGRYFLSTVGELPTIPADKDGTIVANVVDTTLDVYFPTGWKQFQQQGPQGEVGPEGPQGEVGLVGPQGETGNQGPPGIVNHMGRPSPGSTDEVTLLLAADGWAMLPWEIKQGDYLTILDIVGWVTWQDDLNILQGYTGYGTYYHTGATAPDAGASFILADEPIMSLLCGVNARMAGTPRIEHYPIEALVAAAEIENVAPEGPYAILECNHPNTPIYGSLYGHLLVTIQLQAVLNIVDCGESDFTVGLFGWYKKPGSEEFQWPNGGATPEFYAGGYYANGFGFYSTIEFADFPSSPDGYAAVAGIKAVLAETTSIPSFTIIYEILVVDKTIVLDIARQYDDDTWAQTTQSIPNTLGEHSYETSGDLGDWKALSINLRTAYATANETSFVIKSVTLNCD